MSVTRSVADVLRDHVVLELEAIDRMYLNVYVPHLQIVRAVAARPLRLCRSGTGSQGESRGGVSPPSLG
jgi:hypothetical protein